MGQIQSAGIKQGTDAYHNQFLDTSSLLESSLRKGLNSKGGSKKSAILASSKNMNRDETPEETLREFGIKTGVGERTINEIASLKENVVALYQESSNNTIIANKIEKVIRRIEDIQMSLGIESDIFDPLKNRSGLETVEHLENADKVIQNTLNHYGLYTITSIKTLASSKGPAIDIHIIGESGEVGFEIIGSVIAEDDFDGNEAVDYVYSANGGLMSVKARSQGTWKDVSEKFIINCGVKRYKLEDSLENIHSAFIGEKIISEGKDKIIKALNINNEDVKFGKCRVFSKNREIIDSIRTLVRVNK
jgi:hypothetical protein